MVAKTTASVLIINRKGEREEGEEFEVSNERFKVLTKDNEFKEVFVEKVEEIETAVKDLEKETTKKRTSKKVK